MPTPKSSAGDIMEEEGFFLPPRPTAIFCCGSSVFLVEEHLVTTKSLNTPCQGLGPVAWPAQSSSWHWPTPCWGVHPQQESGHPQSMLKAVPKSLFTSINIVINYH